jgi:GntR family transcriptional regulator/MocR family aminotransferase
MPAGISIDRKSAVPLHRQLEEALRGAILSGRLSPGERILSSRELQTHLGVSRNTVLGALEQLHAEGYLVTTRGVGTFVAPNARALLTERKPKSSTQSAPSDRVERFAAAQSLTENFARTMPFRPGIPALDLFPTAQFKRALDPSSWTPAFLDYSGPYGHRPLREAIARRIRQTRGVVCSADQILITGGAQAAFSLVVRVLLNDRDAAVVEEPGYRIVRAALHANGMRIIPGHVDADGLDVASFRNKRAKLVYVTPSHQYPTGAVLSLERRLALLDWAAKHGAWIVEDDYDSEFNYTDRVHPALQGLGDGQSVIYIGTFSKVLAPALRIAYVVVPRALRAAFRAVQRVEGGAPDAIVQNALANFIDNGSLGRHIVKMRKVYNERRAFANAALSNLANLSLRVIDSHAGLHFIAELPDEIRDAAFSRQAASAGIVVPALSEYFIGKPWLNGIVVGYAATPVPSAKEAIEMLSRCG